MSTATDELALKATRIAQRHAYKLVIDMVDNVLKLPDDALREGLEAMKQACYDDLVRLSAK